MMSSLILTIDARLAIQDINMIHYIVVLDLAWSLYGTLGVVARLLDYHATV